LPKFTITHIHLDMIVRDRSEDSDNDTTAKPVKARAYLKQCIFAKKIRIVPV